MSQFSKYIDRSLIDEKELWKNYHHNRENGDGEPDRNKLVEYHMPLVRNVAERIVRKMPPHTELDDLIQEGVFGLIDAIEENDGKNFGLYAFIKVKEAILKSLREWYPSSVLARLRDKQVEKAKARLNCYSSGEQLIDELSKDEYVADSINRDQGAHLTPRKKALRIIDGAERVKKIKSLSEISYDEVEKDNTSPAALLQKKELIALVSSLMKGLTTQELKVIDLYYFKDKTLKEIGKVMGISKQAVDQIKDKALKHLEHKARMKKIGLEDIE